MSTQAALQSADNTSLFVRGRKLLLLCGILASIVYVVGDIVAANMWPAYSYRDQSVSELMSIGAPTRALIVVFFTACNVLSLAFVAGAFASARRRVPVVIACWFFSAYCVTGEVACLFFPMHQRGGGSSYSDVMHIAITAFLVLSTFLFIGFGAAAGPRAFRVYSWLTILMLLCFGVWAGTDGSNVAHNLPTPWLGIKERVNIYGALLWIALFARVLMRNADTE